MDLFVFFFTCRHPVRPAILLKILSISFLYFWLLYHMWGVCRCVDYIWVFGSAPLLTLSGCASTMQFLLLWLCSLQSERPCVRMFLWGLFSSCVFLFFHMRLSIVLLRSVDNCVGSLLGIALNLPIQFRSSKTWSVCHASLSLARLVIPKTFHIVCGSCECAVSLISSSVCLLFV